MKTTQTGDEIYATVKFASGNFMILHYEVEHFVGVFAIEIPITDNNKHLNLGDEVVLRLLMEKI